MGWRRFFHRAKWDQERARELESYLEIETEENISRGMQPADAHFAALRKLGRSTSIREDIYHMNSIAVLENTWKDFRYALRVTRKNPMFSVLVVFSLAIGIGANTAIFSFVDAVLLRMLPVENPQQIVQFHGINEWFSYPAFIEFRDHNHVFSGVVAFAKLSNANVETGGSAGIAQAQMVSGTYFPTLGVAPALGRMISPEDDEIVGASPVAVISFDYWQTRFAGDPAVIGKKITLNNFPLTIIGVSQPEFFGVDPGQRMDLSIPLKMLPQVWPGFAATGTPYYVFTSPVRQWVRVLARLRPGVTNEEAIADMQPVFARVKRNVLEAFGNADPDSRQLISHARFSLASGGRGLATLRERFSKPLLLLMAAVGLLLLITCANVANLLLARATARQREIAIRLSIGAGRMRLIRQLITETVVLAFTGGAFGLLLAYCGSKPLLLLISHSATPITLDVRPDVRVLVFTLGVSMLAAIVSGVAPAWRAVGLRLGAATIESTRNSAELRTNSHVSSALVAFQVALSLVLMISAGLLARSLSNLKSFYPGFDTQNVLLLTVNPDLAGYKGDKSNAFYIQVIDRIAALPGVRSVSFSMDPPMTSGLSFVRPAIDGASLKKGVPVGINIIGPDYFKTLQTSMLLGRDVTRNDVATAPKVAIVNEKMALDYFGSAYAAVGRRISAADWVGDTSWLQIVGVVQDAKQRDLREPATPIVYLPLFQSGAPAGVTFEIRTTLNPSGLIKSALSAIAQIDPRVPVFHVRTLDDQLNDSLVQERLLTSLSSCFGCVAVLLACVGLYGLMNYTVQRRTREIGLRMALGAHKEQVAAMVIRQTLALIGIGLALGIPAARAASQYIASELYSVGPGDPLTVTAISLLIALIALIAVIFPARRAAGVEPMQALRYE
jgi:predicted permease